MNGDKQSRRVFRLLMAWNDQKEEQWLSQQAREGWHVAKVGPLGYRLEKGTPADVAYRLDVLPRACGESAEYLELCRDAGWELVGRRGLWRVFRKPVAARETMEIHTHPESRIAAYRRVLGFMAVMAAAMVSQAMSSAMRDGGLEQRHVVLLVLQVLLASIFGYGALRMALTINRLRKLER